jgi:hypothetical protein
LPTPIHRGDSPNADKANRTQANILAAGHLPFGYLPISCCVITGYWLLALNF